jgi:hypothetical protein
MLQRVIDAFPRTGKAKGQERSSCPATAFGGPTRSRLKPLLRKTTAPEFAAPG